VSNPVNPLTKNRGPRLTPDRLRLQRPYTEVHRCAEAEACWGLGVAPDVLLLQSVRIILRMISTSVSVMSYPSLPLMMPRDTPRGKPVYRVVASKRHFSAESCLYEVTLAVMCGYLTQVVT
jgi:hypothetical protein